MKAAVFKGAKNIVVQDIELRDLQEQEILIKVRACGICGTDVHIYNGDEGAAKTTPPTILGHEFSGEIVEVGSEVNDLKIGDKVSVDPNQFCGKCDWCQNGKGYFCESMVGYGTNTNGGFAQYCIVPEQQAFKFENLSFEEAAMGEPLACCLHGIELCNIQFGDHVTVIGGGMIGLTMVQLAKKAGASKVVLIEPVENKRKLAEEYGALLTIDPINKNVVEVLRNNKIKNNCVIECVGTTSTIDQAIEIADKGAKVMLYGLTSPEETVSIKPFRLFQKEITLLTSFINPFTQLRSVELLENKVIDVSKMILPSISLEELASAIEGNELRSQGKVVVDPWL